MCGFPGAGLLPKAIPAPSKRWCLNFEWLQKNGTIVLRHAGTTAASLLEGCLKDAANAAAIDRNLLTDLAPTFPASGFVECRLLEGLYAASRDWVEARLSLDVYAQRDAPQMMIDGGVGREVANEDSDPLAFVVGALETSCGGCPIFFFWGGNSSSLKRTI